MTLPARFINYQEELNSEQLDVVTAPDGRYLVLAGAGSGKTRVLTYRVAHLLNAGVRPERILLMTFTNKAAKEMMTRVKDLTGIDTNRLYGGTFHGMANRFLRMYGGGLAGYSSSFTIIDQDESFQIINAASAALNYDSKKGSFPKGAFLGALYSYARNTDQKIADIIENNYPELSFRIEQIAAVLAEYKKRKLKQNTMDFDDLLCNLRRFLIENPGVRGELNGQFLHVLVDEFQDTNAVQNDLVDLLGAKASSLICVGDDFQSIYAFRGAVFDNILKFSDRYPDAHIYYLQSNYRSTPQIVEFANQSIRHNANQFKKHLVSKRKSGHPPVFVQLANTSVQADFVAGKIKDLITSGNSPDSIAVLYRAHYHSMELQMELTRRNVPFIVRSGMKFFDAAHIKDTASFLRVLCNPVDEPAWRRLFLLIENIGSASAHKLIQMLVKSDNPLGAINSEDFRNAVPRKAKMSISWLRDAVNMAVQERATKPAELIKIFLDCGYREYLKSKYESWGHREDDLLELVLFSARYNLLSDFLAEIALVSTDEQGDADPEDDKGRVVLSTIHRSKGLEWDTVFLLSCADGMIPLERCLEQESGEEEERRLFYVAVTRAKSMLIMTMPEYNYRKRDAHCMEVSRFIAELEGDNTDAGLLKIDLWD
ncbi:MAG TPA: ATP-dependent helicase [Smithella sp.]|nr:ATP-dependent helicase [Smithella sp.]